MPNPRHKHSSIIQQILKSRGCRTDKDIEQYFDNNLKNLPDLSKLKGIQRSADRIIKAIRDKENIAVYGDYDVDGTTSCALLYKFFKLFDLEIFIMQPSRFIEGYGIHNSAIDNAIKRDIKVLITVDCGITNVKTAQYAKEKKIDLIITDHHKDIAPCMPPAYSVINPNRRDEDTKSEMTTLAGVGVAFALAVQIRKTYMQEFNVKIESIYNLLQYVAIGTICDIAYLSNMNLKLVRHGLTQLPTSKFSGLLAFLNKDQMSLKMLPSESLSFYIGPLINSKGRLEHPDLALRLLIEDDLSEAVKKISQLKITNNERKILQRQVFDEACTQVKDNLARQQLSVAIGYGADWHEGVIGIVASKIVENFNLPAIIFTDSKDNDILKSSIRTAGDLNIFEELNKLSHLFLKFGGHKAAAGLSMQKSNLEEFSKQINKNIFKIPEILRTNQSNFDIQIDSKELTPTLVKELQSLEPFGNGNQNPIFKISNLTLLSFQYLKEKHLKLMFKTSDDRCINGISFFYSDKFNVVNPKEILDNNLPFSIYATLGINRYRGNEFLQLMIKSISI